jgi:ribonuclease R
MKKNNTKKETNRFQGIISISSKGTGYVSIPTLKEDPEIDYKHLNTALHGDMVEIILHPKTNRRQTAEVVRITERAKTKFIGTIETENNLFFFKPDDTRMYTDILIPLENLNHAKNGDKTQVQITAWEDHRKMPKGEVLKVLGKAGDHETEMRAIAIDKGFAHTLENKTEEEAKRIHKEGISEKDFVGRKDFRETLTFTIDPSDAKDFDDAISFKELSPDTFEIGIHIADVSHYVKKGSDLDEEARERGTSVYLVDRTIPMLPEILSNNLCSLVPNEDRLTMSAVFTMNKNADVLSEWFGKTVIHSSKRFTYEEAEKSIHNTNTPLHNELKILNEIAKKLTAERFKNGAVSLEQEEVKFILDENFKPIKVIKKARGDSNKLIEEFMLLANKKVAEKMAKNNPKDSGFIYRVHDVPPKEKMEELILFLKGLGLKLKIQNNALTSQNINEVLKKLEGHNEKDSVSRAIIKSMSKAVYSTKNIGHYGLAFKYYTHFTSPIRRYPDVIVHRLLNDFLNNKKLKKEDAIEYEKISRKSSEQEKRATEAERASIKYKQVEYMSARIGQKFTGIISGINEWGIFVEEKETKCEGLVRIRDIEDDFYIFDEKKLQLVGKKEKKTYKLGDEVKIKVKNVDLERKTIDYILV